MEIDRQQEIQMHRALFAGQWKQVFGIKAHSWQGRAIVMQTTRAFQAGGWRKRLQNDAGLRTFAQR